MPKVKRRMIDADKLIRHFYAKPAHHQAGHNKYHSQFTIIADIERMLKNDSTCDFRNPGWEERAKEHDTTA